MHIIPSTISKQRRTATRRRQWAYFGRREHMVGVKMVLAEFVKLKHGLYKSCGIECLGSIMLEPCLLQPCFHVAGALRPFLIPALRTSTPSLPIKSFDFRGFDSSKLLILKWAHFGCSAGKAGSRTQPTMIMILVIVIGIVTMMMIMLITIITIMIILKLA